MIYYALVRLRGQIIENRKLGNQGELQLIYETSEDENLLLSVYGRTTDALASGGDEGRGRLRKAAGSRQQALIRGYPNGTTRHPSRGAAGGTNNIVPRSHTWGSETSQYPEEEKSSEIARVAASESARAQTGKHASRGCGTRTRHLGGQAKRLESRATAGESPLAEDPTGPTGIPIRAEHVKLRPNPGGPPSKAEHYPMTDSEQVPRGKGEKNRF